MLEEVQGLLRRLGFTPEDVAYMTIAPQRIEVWLYQRDADGSFTVERSSKGNRPVMTVHRVLL